MNHPALEMVDTQLTYASRAEEVVAFTGASFSLSLGETMAVIGPSGSGKSSLLHVAGALASPSQGEVWLMGERATSANAVRLRRSYLGFVFQFHHLLADLTAEENIAAGIAVRGGDWGAARKRARGLLARFDMAGLARRTPDALSGGERQRVAIARALAARPALVIADEPTGSLDPRAAEHAFAMLMAAAREENAAVLVATHNHALATRADRTLTLEKVPETLP